MKNIFKLFGLVLVSLTALSSCGEKEGTPVTTLSLNYSTYECYEDDYFNLVATTNSKKAVKFYTSDLEVASVSSSGLVLAKKEGNVKITAVVESLTSECVVSIKPLSEKIEGYIVTPESIYVCDVMSEKEVKIEPKLMVGGSEITSTFTFKSLDESIAKVNENGVIEALNEGKVNVEIKAGDITKDVLIDAYTLVVNNVDDWMGMLDTVARLDARFYINADIDFTGVDYRVKSGYDDKWNMIMFMAEIEGNNHTISNITFPSDVRDQSIFGFGTHIQLSNLRFVNTKFTAPTGGCAGLFVKIMRHVNIDGENKILTSLISNVLCDFLVNTSCTLCGIARDVYGVAADSVYINFKNYAGKPLTESKTFAIGQTFYLWWDGSFATNIIINSGVDNISLDASHKEGALNLDQVYLTHSIPEANYYASKYFDSSTWNILPDVIPSFR